MSLVDDGKKRILGVAGAIDLVVYGFSAQEANHVMRAFFGRQLKKGELHEQLVSLERPRVLQDGFTTSLSRREVMNLVMALPSAIDPLRKRPPRQAAQTFDLDEMRQMARGFVHSMKDSFLKAKLTHLTGQDWHPKRLLRSAE